MLVVYSRSLREYIHYILLGQWPVRLENALKIPCAEKARKI
jgi:hypothetical protein